MTSHFLGDVQRAAGVNSAYYKLTLRFAFWIIGPFSEKETKIVKCPPLSHLNALNKKDELNNLKKIFTEKIMSWSFHEKTHLFVQ